MEVNFFKRRKILKKSNALDLIPVRLLNHEPRGEVTLNILLPRFKKPWLARIMAPQKRKEFIRIKLDQFGSATWLLIDGIKPVRTICDELEKEYPGKLQPESETVDRVNKFMTILYQQRFISFQQLQKKDT
ncbi:MAG: PqqD family protein [Bacteroidales bacterium]|nr:PqqD family protein [Bacteroidales bacterium]